MRTMIMILALAVPLMAQEVEVKEDAKAEVVVLQGCTYDAEGICISCQAPHLKKNKGFKIKKEIRFSSDRGDRRGRMGMQQTNQDRKKMYKKQQIRQVIRLAVIGGLAYYMGYHQGEKHFKPSGMKRRPYLGDRK